MLPLEACIPEVVGPVLAGGKCAGGAVGGGGTSSPTEKFWSLLWLACERWVVKGMQMREGTHLLNEVSKGLVLSKAAAGVGGMVGISSIGPLLCFSALGLHPTPRRGGPV